MVLNKYNARGLNGTIIHGDNYFNIAQLKEVFLPILVEIYGKDDHVVIIERVIRVMK